jgi:hypothetical protein
MRRLILMAFMLLLAVSCGGGGVRSAPAPLSIGGFELADVDLMGGGKLVAEVVGTASAPEVIVKAEGAEGLKAVYVTLKHPEGYRPVEVKFGGFLGAEEEVISLAVTGRHGEVPCGIIKVHADEVEGVSGSGEVLRVKYEAGADTAAKAVSTAPGGGENKPTDLRLIETATAGTYILRWHERNVGDYDNNGTVAIADITPLAMNFGSAVADENSAVGLADGDGNETIGIADVTPIAVHFGTALAGYNVYVAGNATPLPNEGNPGEPLSVMRQDDAGSTRVEYEYSEVLLAGTEEVTVAPGDNGGAEGIPSDPATVAQPEIPNPPANLAAIAKEAIGPGRILLTWSANTEPDLAEYRLYRKAEGETEFTQVAAIPKATVPLQYTDNNNGDWLPPGIEYTYYATAVNTSQAESDPSNEAANTPFFPAAPTTPATIATENEGIPYSYSIEVSWGASASDYQAGYEVWRQGPADVDFSLLRTTDTTGRKIYDSGLTVGEDYIYKVRAKDNWGQFSGFTDEASNTPSTYVPMEIYSVTTDNTTLTIGSTTEKAHLAIDLSNPAASITWSVGGAGVLDDPSSLTPTYSPPASGSPAKVTLTVQADDGMDVLSDSVDVILTSLPVLGPAFDFSYTSWEAPNAPFIPFADYMDDREVIMINFGSTG